MNEKIEKLKKKATVIKGGEFCFDGGDVEIIDVNILVELVVQECADLLTQKYREENGFTDKSPPSPSAVYLKKSFGMIK